MNTLMQWSSSLVFYGRLFIICSLMFGLAVVTTTPLTAQQNKKAAAGTKAGATNNAKKNAKQKQQEMQSEDPELPVLEFSVSDLMADELSSTPVASEEITVKDPDETPEGLQRLTEVTRRAKVLYVEYWGVMRERGPIATPRNALIGEINQRVALINEAAEQLGNVQANMVVVANQMQLANGNELAQLKQQYAALDSNAKQLNSKMQNWNREIEQRVPRVVGLNLQLKPIDERLLKLWNELNACRKQWLDIRAPFEKYTRLEFENLKTVIDDWTRVDGLWPPAHCWAALCYYELGDYAAARRSVEEAERLRLEVYWSRKRWPRNEALKGLIAPKHQDAKQKADGFLTNALAGSDKKTDWETPYLVGRAWMAKKSIVSSKPEAMFKQGLGIQPENRVLKYYLAVLQITGDEKVRNLAEGTKQLEEMWKRTGERSWRISFELAKAYKAAKREDEASEQLEKTLKLAPVEKHDELKLAAR